MMKKNDRVRVLDTDPRPTVRGLTGTIIDTDIAGPPAPVEHRVLLDEAPAGYTTARWAFFERHLEVIPSPAMADATATLFAPLGWTKDFLRSVIAPGYYHVVRDGEERFAIASFTADTGETDGGPEEPAGVWVATHLDPDNFSIIVDSVHEEEVEAWRALDTETTRPRVTFVEFGAPVSKVVTETHGL